MDKVNRIKQLINILNEAGKTYYQEDKEIIPNLEYDILYDELENLEKQTGMIFSNSPTINVGYEILSELPKEKHDTPMLSLDKTKNVEDLEQWIADKEGMLSWKLDGLTIVLKYNDGKLEKAVTRGNGSIGEVITNNAKMFSNLPIEIDYKKELVIRGEAIIKYSDFEKINSKIQDVEAKYKNPRNLCSGTVRQLNNKITAERKVNFYAFALVKVEDFDFNNSRINQIEWLKEKGFDIVEYKRVKADNLKAQVKWFAEEIGNNDLPSDGLVLIYDDIEYGKSLGSTSKFPKDAIAFKWKDEIKETELVEIEWSASRTGLINPIAVFNPVELEGTVVSRASLHNLSIFRNLELGKGDIIKVYKANMIIPQVFENLTKSGTIAIPGNCPVCGSVTQIKNEKGAETLNCPNEKCLAKQIKGFTHFVSRDAMNMEGLSEATIEKLIAKGLVKELADLYDIKKFKDEIIEMEGFGEKSFENLLSSVEKARSVSQARLLYSLGIPNIGLTNAKLICRSVAYDWSVIEKLSFDELMNIDGVGPIMAQSFVNYFSNEENRKIVKDIINEIEFERIDTESTRQDLKGKVFVITGALEIFKNRSELKTLIENRGGKVVESVSNKTSLLINNDKLSNSSKNKKAKEFGIEIISEKEFLDEVLNA